jgi:hypothetical protein
MPAATNVPTMRIVFQFPSVVSPESLGTGHQQFGVTLSL